jgi:hypothetical protein
VVIVRSLLSPFPRKILIKIPIGDSVAVLFYDFFLKMAIGRAHNFLELFVRDSARFINVTFLLCMTAVHNFLVVKFRSCSKFAQKRKQRLHPNAPSPFTEGFLLWILCVKTFNRESLLCYAHCGCLLRLFWPTVSLLSYLLLSAENSFGLIIYFSKQFLVYCLF